MSDPYLVLASAVQAYRRKSEALNLGLGGALGVVAEPYPHQIATVRRILSDTRIRHLIADEVGLGKTIQALMIINALRWQTPSHRTIVLVPDKLVRQWQDECWTRCHCSAAVVGATENPDVDNATVRIVRPQSISSGVFKLDSAQFDLLVIDEPQTMPVAVMAEVERFGQAFRQLLLLSATPGLGDVTRRSQLMRLLEPDRALAAQLLGEDIDQTLMDIEEKALQAFIAGNVPAQMASYIFNTFCSERRIARSRRSDWGRYLPARNYERITVEPLKGEADRVRIALDWLNETGAETEADGEAWKFLQAVHRGHPSARRAATARMRPGNDTTILAAVQEASATSPGDSRFDALLDIISQVWERDPKRQIIIVAGDNPTIDFLSPRLKRYFGTEEDPIEISELRRSSEALEDEAEDVRFMFEQLEEFSRGRSTILLVGEWVQAGLNLHYYAREIVFYSCPWDPDAVDQLIGRLDRLRPNSLEKADLSQSVGNVQISCIAQRNTVETKVISGLEAVSVFSRPLPPVPPEEAEAMMKSLEMLAFSNSSSSSIKALESLAKKWSAGWSLSKLASFSPYTPAAAQISYDRLSGAKLPEPVIRAPEKTGESFIVRAEEALLGWLNLMDKARFFDIGVSRDRKDENIKFSTIWYTGRTVSPSIPEISGGAWRYNHVPFLFRRRHLAIPPRNVVHTDDGESDGRLLRFLDHGDGLHDSLVLDFQRQASESLGHSQKPREMVVLFPEGHAALALRGKTLLLTVAWLDPGLDALPQPHLQQIREFAISAPTEAQRESLSADIRVAEDFWLCDQRWLRNQLPTLFQADVSQLEGTDWIPVSEELKWEIFKPLRYGKEIVCAKGREINLNIPTQIIVKGLEGQKRRLNFQAQGSWRSSFDKLRMELEMRLRQVEREGEDLCVLRESEAEKRKTERSGSVEQLREGIVAAAERRVTMARLIAKLRLEWLSAILRLVEQATPNYIATLLIRPSSRDN